MAILRDVAGVKVEVFMGGTPLPEYENQEQDSPNTSAKWIEAVTGTEFAVKISFTDRYRSRHGVRTQVCLDGKVMCSSFHHAKNLRKPEGHMIEGASSRTDKFNFLQKFKFAELTTVEDSNRKLDESLKRTLESTGVISVQMWAVKNLKRKGNSRKTVTRELEALGTLPSKALLESGLSHSGSLGERETAAKRRTFSYRNVHGHDSPFATFHFKYRSLASLKNQGIVPRTPSPPPQTPTPVAASVREDSDTEPNNEIELTKEACMVLARYYQKKAQGTPTTKRKIKIERLDDDPMNIDDDEVSMVAERSTRRPRALPTNQDGVIELD